jgi:hypothetical protein
MSKMISHGALDRRRIQPRVRLPNTDEYLFSSPANAERLLRAYDNALAGRNMVEMSLDELDAWVRERLSDSRGR